MGAPEKELDKIAHIALPLGKGNMLMGTDTTSSMPGKLTMGNNFHITLEPDSAQEAEALFNKLSAGGKVNMPLQKTEWAEKYGIAEANYGVQWMVSYTGNTKFGSSASTNSSDFSQEIRRSGVSFFTGGTRDQEVLLTGDQELFL